MDTENFTQEQLALLNWRADRLKQLHEGRDWHEKQRAVFKAIYRDGFKRIFIRKGRKGGGTETILYPMVREAGTKSNQACYVIGPQETLQKEILWKNNRIQSAIPRQWNIQSKESEGRVVFHDTKSFIKVHGADNHKKMVGIEGDIFVFDEFADHDKRAYDNCYPNTASRDATLIVVGAPPLTKTKSSHYYKLEKAIRKDPNWFFIHWSIWDNAQFLPAGVDWIKKEKAAYYARGDWDLWETLYEARYVTGGRGTVLSYFVSDPMMEGSQVVPHDVLMTRFPQNEKRKMQWYRVFDPGYATTFCVLFCCYNPYIGEAYFLREVYEDDRKKISTRSIWEQVETISEQLLPGGADKWVNLYDSAAAGFPQEVTDTLGKKGVLFTPTYKQDDDEDKYFRTWNSGLFTGQIWLSEECPHLIDEMEDYATNERGNYPDSKNHALDNGRYFLKHCNFSAIAKAYDVRIKNDRRERISLEEEIARQESQHDPMAQMMGGQHHSQYNSLEQYLMDSYGMGYDDGSGLYY